MPEKKVKADKVEELKKKAHAFRKGGNVFKARELEAQIAKLEGKGE